MGEWEEAGRAAAESLKLRWRAEMNRRLNAMDEAQRAEESQRICEHLLGSTVWRRARVVTLFAPMRTEPDVRPLWFRALAEGKVLTLPRYNLETRDYSPAVVTEPERDVVRARFGIEEPRADLPSVGWEEPDLLIVPGMAFDRRGNRLGRGWGYYDVLLARTRGFRCGVAFRCQYIERVPVLPHDVPVHAVVTASGWFELTGAGGAGQAGEPGDPRPE